ncbi:MAG: aminotransferase class V-fold PLP-dependent enzyme [Chthoniobacterales bacterium]|nr:aminotransferase class V-fold PLP-dependent enzyme [Chthoniobacterales bacterium]
MQRQIYLDHNATTPILPEVLDAMLPWLSPSGFGNPSSSYSLGKAARNAIEAARLSVATLIGASPEEIIFTSCGTESIHSAILSALSLHPDRHRIITSSVEHSATLKLCNNLARKGYQIVRLPVDNHGLLPLNQLADSLDNETAIVSLLWANNETGVLFPVEEIAALCHQHDVLLHIDAVQAIGKLPPLPLHSLPGISYLSLSGHKIHAPKGVAALYINRRSRFSPLLFGSQENSRRGGTENVASIVAFGKAADISLQNLESTSAHIRKLRDQFEDYLLQNLDGIHINGARNQRLPNTSNISFEGIQAETALLLLDKEGIYCSAGSACTSGSIAPSHVLTAMGIPPERARSSLRFSFGKANQPDDAILAASTLTRIIRKIRSENPSTLVISRI